MFPVGVSNESAESNREKRPQQRARNLRICRSRLLLLLRNVDLMPGKVPTRMPRKPKTPSSSSRLLGKSSGYVVDICGRRILGSNGRPSHGSSIISRRIVCSFLKREKSSFVKFYYVENLIAAEIEKPQRK